MISMLMTPKGSTSTIKMALNEKEVADLRPQSYQMFVLRFRLKKD